ncbi:hypothetical protein ONZ51_g2545 [Trametes cubensis]|uniref:Uncharacterized protein n=1 Tax=Trametes cubensis TaxID=1111947 RepID=A0AAD7TZI0_9APHY|nr:hypothetical protein ONZ51_g2545 [Trametes cubensis]
MQPVPVTPPPSSSDTDSISLSSIDMSERPIYSACATHPGCPSPNIHLTVLKLRVPHLFSSRRRPSRPRNLAIMPKPISTVDRSSNRTVDISTAMEIVMHNLHGADPDATHSQRRTASKMDWYQLGIMSRHLLTTTRSDEEFQRRWEDLLQKIEAAFKAVNPLHVSHADGADVMPHPDLDQWIKNTVPKHIQIVRAAYGPGTEEHKRLEDLVKSLKYMRKNMQSLSATVPANENRRREQLDNLMARVLEGLERQQMELRGGIQEAQLLLLADLTADAGDFNAFAAMYDPSNLSINSDSMIQPVVDLQESQGRAGDSDTSHATQDEIQPVAAPDMERHPSDSSEKSSRILTPGSPRSRSSSPRGYRGFHGTRVLGSGLASSTPNDRTPDESRKSSQSSVNHASLFPPEISLQDFFKLQAPNRESYERQITEAVAKKSQERRREVDLVRELLEVERAERKREVDDKERVIAMLLAQLEESKEQRKRDVEKEKEERKRDVEKEKEEREREVKRLLTQLEEQKEERKRDADAMKGAREREVELLMALLEQYKSQATKYEAEAAQLRARIDNFMDGHSKKP